MSGFDNDVVYAKNADFTQADNQAVSEANGLATNGQLWIGTTSVNAGGTHINVGALTSPDSSVAVGYSSPNITLSAGTAMGTLKTITPNEDFDGTAATPISGTTGNINAVGVNPSFATVTETLNSTGLSTGNLQVEHRAWVSGLVVDTSTTPGTRGTYATLASALAAATSGQTVFLRTSVTENVTIPVGVNIAAWSAGILNTPTIIGTVTMTGAGTSTINGIRLQTNGAPLLAVTGSAASVLNVYNCYLNCSNNTGITFSSSSASAGLFIMNCKGNLGTTGIALFSHSSAGIIEITYSNISNSGNSTTASTCSSGFINMEYTFLTSPVTTSGTSAFTWDYVSIDCFGINTTAATLGGSGLHASRYSRFNGGSASAVSCGSATPKFEFCVVQSSNTNAITGAGTMQGNTISFEGTSSGVNTTTQTNYPFGITNTWTPNLQINNSNTGITYTTQTGSYTIIGNVVTIWGVIVLSSKGASVGIVTISNLPIATSANGGNQQLNVGECNAFTAAGYTTLAFQLGNSSTVSQLIMSSVSGSGVVGATNTNLANTTILRFSGTYIL